MKTALIIMSILGCDDSGSQCHYVETVEQRFASISDCDAVAPERLNGYGHLAYPTVIAVCEPLVEPEGTVAAVSGAAEQADAPETENPASLPAHPIPKADIPDPRAPEIVNMVVDEKPGLAARVLAKFQKAVQPSETVKAIANAPLHFVSDSYSWVVKRFDR